MVGWWDGVTVISNCQTPWYQRAAGLVDTYFLYQLGSGNRRVSRREISTEHHAAFEGLDMTEKEGGRSPQAAEELLTARQEVQNFKELLLRTYGTEVIKSSIWPTEEFIEPCLTWAAKPEE